MENLSSSFSVRIVNQTISSVLMEWDPIADADVYKIEKHHKPTIWTRVYWGSKRSAKVDHLDENFCYKFRISALQFQPTNQKGYVTLAASEPIRVKTLPSPPSTIHLYRAIKKGQQFLVKRLLNMHPNLVDLASPNSYYPLANAIIFGEKDIIDILLSAGASVHMGNWINGVTPLHLAFYHGHLTVAKILLNKNAKLDAADCICLTPIHYAIIADNYEMLKFGIENKCDMEAKDICGWTPLQRAVAMGSKLSIIKLLVNHGADVKVTNKFGLSGYEMATGMRNDEIANYLYGK